MKKNFEPAGCTLLIRFTIFIFAFFCSISYPALTFAETSQTVISGGHSKEDINRGKRFFMGLLPFESKHQSCVSCHNLTATDTLNWNPSAMDIALKYAGKDSASFRQVIMEP